MTPTAGDPIPLRLTGSKPPLCCLPAASGSGFIYAALTQRLRPDRAVYAFEAPGFDDERAPAASVPTLANAYLAALESVDKPYSLLGWSMGGTVAFEIARRPGHPVPSLILIDTAAPGAELMPTETELVRAFLGDLGSSPPVAELEALVSGAPRESLTAHVFSEIEKAGWLPSELDAGFLAHRYAVFSSSARAAIRYTPTGRYPGEITLIRAAESPPDAYHGWAALADRVEERTAPGDHYTMWRNGGLRELSRIVQECVDRGDERYASEAVSR